MSSTDYTNDDLKNPAVKPGEEPATSHDVGEGGVLGAVGGAIVGALAGGPVGAVIGAIAGGAASAGAVSVVDKHDHDYARTVGTDTAGTTATTGTAPAYDSGTAATDYNATATPAYEATTATGYNTAGTTGYNATAATGTVAAGDQVVVPIVEEELLVGKREVDRGGAVVRTGVIETPVQEQVTLRDEHVTVDRRPVDRAASAGDLAFQGGVIEVTETGEEAVVAKNARVVEEVVVGKTATERTETVHDTVRRTDVQVEEVDGLGAHGTDTRGTTR